MNDFITLLFTVCCCLQLSVETYEMITQGIFDQLAPVLANITEETFITYVSPSPQSGVRIANGGGWWMQLSIIVRVGGKQCQGDLDVRMTLTAI